MKAVQPRVIIGIVGGSGSGKTWLTQRLQRALGDRAMRLALDDFYRDRSHLSPARRAQINFDHPRAIDWKLFIRVLTQCRRGLTASFPRYNFATHTRSVCEDSWNPAPLILVEGLWLLHDKTVRALFDFGVYLDCPAQLRLERRLARDLAERGRSVESVREQFWKTVAPMHRQFVAPQSHLADLILDQPSGDAEIQLLIDRIETLARASATRASDARKHSRFTLDRTPEYFTALRPALHSL